MSTPPLFYLSRGGESITGPHAAGYLRQGLASGRLTLDTPTCLEGTQDWLPMNEFFAEIGIPKPQPEQVAAPSRKGPWLAGAALVLLFAGVIAFTPKESKEAKSRRAAAENLARMQKDLEASKIAADIDRKVREYAESRRLEQLKVRTKKKEEVQNEYSKKRINFAEKEMLLKTIDQDEEKDEQKILELAEMDRAELNRKEEEKKRTIEQWNKEHADFIRTYP
ncbi:MAG: hypothetical protein JWM59_2443 [Verrucomicrobiales bacterium]|nr:hypothetical protein [Verrucomicrobiales bacterium]